MKKIAPILSYLFHPMLMPTAGLFLLLNSGTYVSLMDPAAKRAILFVMALGTLFFPLMMMPILYYRNLMSRVQNSSQEEKLLSQVIILILYIITFVYFVRLPLSRIIHSYVLGTTITFTVVLLLGIWFRVSLHTTALGGLAGLIIALILLYESPLQGVLMIVVLAGGFTASSRLALGASHPAEVYVGYLVGFGVVFITLMVY